MEGFIPKPFNLADLKKVLEEVKKDIVLPSFGMTEVQQKTLLEIGKSGTKSASNALSQILKRKIDSLKVIFK